MFSVFAFETLLHYVDFDYEIHNSKDEDGNEYLALCLIDKEDVYLGGKDTYAFPIYNLDSVQDAVEAAIDRLDNYWFDYLKDESEKWKAEIRNAINNPKFYVDTSELYNRIYELCPLTDEEIESYCLNQGTGISYDENNNRIITQETIDYWRSVNRIRQFAYAVRTSMDLIDYDEWQALETKLFGQDSEELNALTACRINGILWTDVDVTPLDLI